MTGVPLEAFITLLAALDRLEIQYMVAGSGASSVYGFWWATGDIDLVAKLTQDDIDPLVEVLRPDFYIDEEQIRQALQHRRAFNVIHLASSFKFGIFPLGPGRFEQMQFARRRFEESDKFGPEPLEFSVASPEDVILSKLNWYRLGGCTSENQWNDILGVIAVKRNELDMGYLHEWADYLKIRDLLEQAFAEKQKLLV
jgi:hypothetical protein